MRTGWFFLRCIALLLIAGTLGMTAPLAQDATRGAHVFRKCAVCHTTDPRTEIRLGPPLGGVIGRKAASIEGYDYSDSMKTAGGSGLVWTEEALMYFLDRPDTFMPGTYMTFAGLDVEERRDVIAYLKTLAGEPQPAEGGVPFGFGDKGH